MPLICKQHSNGFWYISGTITVWRNGEPHSIEFRRKSTRTRNQAEADGIRRNLESAQAERNITGKEPALPFQQAAQRYMKNGGEERFLAKPVARLGRVRIDQITQQMLDDESLIAYPSASDATRRRQFHAPVIAVLRANGIERSFKRPSDGPKRTLFLRPEQAVAIIERIKDSRWPNPWTPALFTFLFGQGSRVRETLLIDGKRDISLNDRYAILRDTKSGKERMVPLCRRTIAAVSQIPNLGHSGPLFLRYDGRPYADREDRGYKFGAWDRSVDDMSLDDCTPHVTRHSWATWFYSQTKDVVRLKAEGGWDSSEWERYVKLGAPSIGAAAMRYGFDFSQKVQSGEFSTARNVV